MSVTRVRGYASVFGNVDSYGEVVDAGAFSGWLADNPDTAVPIFWEHDHVFSAENPATPIGKTTMLRQDETGLYYEGELADTPKAQEIAALLKQGAIQGASFAFRVQDSYEKNEVTHLSALSLREISPVNWGANDKAYIEAIPDQEKTEDE